MATQRTDTTSVLELVINGQRAKASVKELRDTFYKLNTEIANMRKADDPKAYAEKAKKVQQLKDAWTETRNEINGTTKGLFNFKAAFGDIAKGVFGGNLLTRGFEMVTRGIGDFITKNAELSDQMAGVAKTTGLTDDAIDRLNDKFKKLDTRSAKSELLGLAEIAGRLGFTLESDVEAFVRAADKIGVALGEELGGTEDAVRSIGKLVDIFKVSDSFGLEESLLKVGSAINELGQSGTANEKYLIDFTQRMAGIAPTANISMANVLGMAATLDELGQQLESSSTAIGQFIVKMGADIPKFAKIAEMSISDFSKLLKEDANEAFLRVLESSSSAGGGIELLAEKMGLIGVAGARGIASLGTLASNVDRLREKQTLSTESFDEGTSIIAEFDRVNNTLGANLEKLKKRFDALWERSSLRNWFTDLTAQMLKSSEETTRLSDEFYKQQGLVKSLESSIVPLISQYEELKEKGELNKDEQTELNVIISKITSTIPHAAVEFDKYGRVIAISTEKVKEFIEAQQAMLSYQNQATIKEAEKDLEKYNAKITELQHTIKTGRSTWVQELFFGNQTLKLNDKAYEQNVKKLSQYGQLKRGAEELLKSLKGDDLNLLEGNTDGSTETNNRDKINTELARLEDERLEKLKSSAQKEKEAIREKYQALRDLAIDDKEQLKKINDQEQKELAAVKVPKEKAIKITEAEKLAAELIKINDDVLLNSLEGFKKEEKAIELKYEKLRVLAKNNAVQLKEINRLEDLENENLKNKSLAAAKKAEDELQEKKNETLQKIKELGLSGAELEIEIERRKYEELIALAQKYGIDVSAIIAAREAGMVAINAKYKEKADEKQKKEDEKKKEREKEIREFAIDSSKMVADAIFQIGENNRKAKYDKEHNDLEDARKKELSNKNLTESQKEAINKKYDAKSTELKRKEFKENQRAAIAEAFINMALGIGKAIPNPFKMAFAGAAGLAQIAVISSQKPQFAKGGILPSGSSHAQGGIDLWDQRRQQVIGNIEGGEPILSRATYANNREIVDELLYSSQRKAGARIQLNPDVIDAERMVRNGGYAMSGKQSAPIVNVSSEAPDFTPLAQRMDLMINALEDFKEIEVFISNRAIEENNRKIAKVRNDVNA